MSNQLTVDDSGDYAACSYCGEVWPNEMLRDDKRMPTHNFAKFRAPCAGSGMFPTAPTAAQVRAFTQSQAKESK